MTAELAPLRGLEDLEQALAESRQAPVLLFKHSATCGLSHMALDEIHDHLRQAATSAVRYKIVTIQEAPDVSDEATARLGVPHRSPQAILIVDGRAVWDLSHLQITSDALEAAARRWQLQGAPDGSEPQAGPW